MFWALSNKLKLTKLLDFGLCDVTPMGKAKCNEGI